MRPSVCRKRNKGETRPVRIHRAARINVWSESVKDRNSSDCNDYCLLDCRSCEIYSSFWATQRTKPKITQYVWWLWVAKRKRYGNSVQSGKVFRGRQSVRSGGARPFHHVRLPRFRSPAALFLQDMESSEY